jgi:hypothetical protein
VIQERNQVTRDIGSEPEEIETDDVLDIDPAVEVVPVSYDITSYGADYPVDGLVKRMNQGDIVVPSFDPAYIESDEIRPFQRGFVWSRPQMDSFIESLLLGLPVPGIFLVREKNNVLLVLDGQQRLRTLQAYYRGSYGDRSFKLKYVQPQFRDKDYQGLDDEDRRRLDDSIVHATVLRQEQPGTSQEAVYSIFERLNTGGSPLQPQEIRVALFGGPFLHLISELNEAAEWRVLYGPKSNRFKDHELILRVFAFYENSAQYSRPLKGFLNHYLGDNRYRTENDTQRLARPFLAACDLLAREIGPRAFRPIRVVNAAVLDSVMFGLMRRLARGPINDPEKFRHGYRALLENPQFGDFTTSSTSSEESVHGRLTMADRFFANVP